MNTQGKIVPNISDVKDFWTENPMTFIDIQDKSVEEIFKKNVEDERSRRWMHVDGKPLHYDWIDYPALRGKKVLEIGYGLGLLADEMICVGADYTGIDLSPYHAEFCKKVFGHKKNARFLEGNAENLRFENNTFDCVLSYGVMHHSPDTQKCIDEACRVLKRGCLFYCMLYRKSFLRYWYGKFFKYGIAKGEIFRYRSIHKVVERHTDTHGGGNGAPISRFLKDRDLRQLLNGFSSYEYSITGNYSELAEFPMNRINIGKVMSPALKQKTLKKFGGYFLITANK